MLVFIAAEEQEFAGLLRNAEMATKLDWPVSFARMARLKGDAVLLLANGPGPRLAARAVNVARERQNVEKLISVGFCGALDPALALSDIFIATEVLDVSKAMSPARPAHAYKSGKLLSMDRVAATAAEKQELRKRGADVVEMEAGAVAERAEHFNIPFYAIRVITDTANEDLPLDFNQMRDAEGRFDRFKILTSAARQPGIFPTLLELNRRCNAAARVLGDFLADTGF